MAYTLIKTGQSEIEFYGDLISVKRTHPDGRLVLDIQGADGVKYFICLDADEAKRVTGLGRSDLAAEAIGTLLGCTVRRNS
jgi:hypothetical protein